MFFGCINGSRSEKIRCNCKLIIKPTIYQIDLIIVIDSIFLLIYTYIINIITIGGMDMSIKSYTLKLTAVLITVIMLFCSCAAAEKPSARVTVDGTKLVVNGNELWLSGMNAPWHNWNDFDGHMDVDFWEREFKRFKEDKINCVRIWVNCTGESIVDLGGDGSVKSVNEAHWTDLEKLFDLARENEVYVMATLLSFDHFKGGGGSGARWQSPVKNREFCDQYAEMYVKEFCNRFGDNEYVFSIDIMNEPDWVYENEECGKVPWENLSYFFGKCAATIHENSDILVTVGTGIIKYNSEKYEGDKVSDEYLQSLCENENAYLDFYSTHYYNWQMTWFSTPVGKTPEEFGLEGGKPCVIGETHNDDEAEISLSLSDKYKDLYNNGWSGILVWSQTDGTEDVWYGYSNTSKATKAMYEYVREKIYPNETADE